MALKAESLRVIRPMAEEDLEAVAAIESSTFPAPWPMEALRYELAENPFASSFVAEVNGEVAGYAFFWTIYEQAHLINIAVAGPLRRMGLGEALLVHAMRHAASHGAEAIHLEVREGNEAAIRLYERYGFEVRGRSEKYYSDGTTAVLMEASLVGWQGRFPQGGDPEVPKEVES
jgi:ribosomal-protein-alanine N-acetyltransferase